MRAFRFVCESADIPKVEALLAAQGFVCEPEQFSPWARRLVAEPFPLGKSLAAFWGLIYIQDRASMLPPLALNPAEGVRILDMCASPGSKTGLLAQLTGKTGLVLANEPTQSRLRTLRQNVFTMNLLQTVTCSWEHLPLADGSWQWILLDPPCSGWGTTNRHPGITALWRSEKLAPLISLQRSLLKDAARMLAPGGTLVYSTCTTNKDENEAQIHFALAELGLVLDAIAPFPGFVFNSPMLPDCAGCLRVDAEASDAQGFFLAKLHKLDAPNLPNAQMETPMPDIHAEYMPDSVLADAGLDIARMPLGRIARFGDFVHFLPACATFPATLHWQGMTIGKATKSGCILAPRLRFLNPDAACRLDLEIEDILALIQGRSLPLSTKCREASLFWHDLPLGRLRIRNHRVLWAER